MWLVTTSPYPRFPSSSPPPLRPLPSKVEVVQGGTVLGLAAYNVLPTTMGIALAQGGAPSQIYVVGSYAASLARVTDPPGLNFHVGPSLLPATLVAAARVAPDVVVCVSPPAPGKMVRGRAR